MSQPDGARPEDYLPRTDAGARKVIDRLDQMAARLDILDREVAAMRILQQGNVTFRGAMGGAVAVLLLAGGFGVFFLSRAEAAAGSAGSRALEVALEAKQLAQAAVDQGRGTERFVKEELGAMKSEIRADLADLKSEVRNTTRAVERTRRPASDGGP